MTIKSLTMYAKNIYNIPLYIYKYMRKGVTVVLISIMFVINSLIARGQEKGKSDSFDDGERKNTEQSEEQKIPFYFNEDGTIPKRYTDMETISNERNAGIIYDLGTSSLLVYLPTKKTFSIKMEKVIFISKNGKKETMSKRLGIDKFSRGNKLIFNSLEKNIGDWYVEISYPSGAMGVIAIFYKNNGVYDIKAPSSRKEGKILADKMLYWAGTFYLLTDKNELIGIDVRDLSIYYSDLEQSLSKVGVDLGNPKGDIIFKILNNDTYVLCVGIEDSGVIIDVEQLPVETYSY